MLNLLYIDPAATTALLTSLTGVVVAIGATGIILWRKFKKKVSKTLHIDENANKEVEEDLIVNDESLLNEVAEENGGVSGAVADDGAVNAEAEVADGTAAEDEPAEKKADEVEESAKVENSEVAEEEDAAESEAAVEGTAEEAE